jgi:hypothetical protein
MSINPAAKINALLLFLVGAFGFTSVYAGGGYSENFSSNSAPGWSVVSGSSTWSAAAGYYTGGSNSDPTAISVYNGNTWSNFTYSISLYNPWGGPANKVGAIFNYQDPSNYYEVRFNAVGTAELVKVQNGAAVVVGTPQTYPNASAGVWFTVKIVRSNQATTVIANGQTIFSQVAQTEFGAGKIGVVSHWDLGRFDNVSVVSDYSETFDSAAQGWTPSSGQWSVTGGYYQQNISPTQGTSVSVYTPPNWDGDLAYSARLYSQNGGGRSNTVGLVYNYQDPQHYYEARFNMIGTATLHLIGPGTDLVVQTATIPAIGAAKWFLAQVIRQGQKTFVFLNGAVVFSNVDQTEYTGGKIGLGAEWTNARFDDLVVSTNAKYKTTYPKIGALYNGGAHDYWDPSYQADLAKLDIAVINTWKGWNYQGVVHTRDVVQAIKALNPRILMGEYTILQRQDVNVTSSDSTYDIKTKLDSEKGPNGQGTWWAWGSLSNQTNKRVGDSSHPDVNITDFVTKDVNGDRFPQWLAKRNNQYLFTPVPEFDIWFTDNVFYIPRTTQQGQITVRTDFDRDGTDDSPTDPAVGTYYRKGNAAYWSAIRSLAPNVMIMGNIDGRGTDANGYLRAPEYQGKIESAFFEEAIGDDAWAEEKWAGWNTMMNSYRSLVANTIDPHLVLFNVHDNDDPNFTDAERYQRMRYGLASALMDDGYYSYTRNYHDVLWYDEYDAPLGTAVDAPPTSAWSNGVYMRRFQNGMVLVNPKGNGTQTVTVPAGYKHLSGGRGGTPAQDPTVNNGQAVTTITLPASDGVVLIKQ